MKTYFNRSTFFICIALIIYILWKLYDHELSSLNDLDFSSYNKNILAVKAIEIINSTLLVAVLVQFMNFMKDCNNRGLFTDKNSTSLSRISVFLLAYGCLAFINNRFNASGDSIAFTIAIFISNISYRFSKIFTEATQNQKEIDLTV